MTSPGQEGLGFDVRPSRPLVITMALFAIVIFAASGFAHYFKELAQIVLEWYSESRDPTVGAASMQRVSVFAIVMGAVIIAATLGRFVERNWSHHVGVEAVSASARGEGRSISLRATAVRAIATWTVFAGMASIGRESAIIESGGAVGATSAKRFRGRGDAMAAAGIAAAFAAAYHAPIAAVFYVEETLRVRSSRRALMFAALGAAGGFFTSIWMYGGEAIFPSTQGSRWTMTGLALIVLVPAVIIARAFLRLRVRVSGGAAVNRFPGPSWIAIGVFAAAAGAAVAWFPEASGNGMDALRQASVGATVTLALALCVGKVIGTSAALAAGAPGGVLTPTVAITSGFVLLAMLGAESLGLTVTHPWDVMVAAMAIGVAVGLRSPFVAVFLIPEVLGDYTLVPVIGVVVGVAMIVDKGVDHVIERFGELVPERVYDEDA
jgi:CIC family chloride channel protein